MARIIRRIYIHCSASSWGEVETIRAFHKAPPPKGRGWKDIGYHFVVCNGFPTWLSFKDLKKVSKFDGLVQAGRPEERMAAHVKNDNLESLGICLVGAHLLDFTPMQMDAAINLAASLCKKYNLPVSAVLGHREYWTSRKQLPLKACPVIDMANFRTLLKAKIGV